MTRREILDAAKRGDREAVESLFRDNPGIITEKEGDKGDTLLCAAAREGDFNVVKILFECCPQNRIAEFIAGKTNFGVTAFHIASHDGHIDVVRLLLEKDPTLCSFTALYSASQNGHIDVVRLLLEKDPTLIGKCCNKDSFTALHLASRNGHIDIVRLLLEKDLTLISKCNKNGFTALHLAALNGHIDVVRFLLEKDLTLAKGKASNGATALQAAAQNGHIDVVRLLLEKDPTLAKDKSSAGARALHLAARNGHIDVVRFLLEKDPTLAKHKTSDGATAFHLAAQDGHIDVVRLLLEKDPTLAKDKSSAGVRALDLAAQNGHIDVVRLLLEKDPTLAKDKTSAGATALHLAARNGHIDVFRFLLEKDPTLAKDKTNTAMTALHLAARNGHIDVFRFLLEKDPTLAKDKTNNAMTALHLAAHDGHINVTRFLLKEYPQLVAEKDIVGFTALGHAIYHKKFENAKILLKYCEDFKLAQPLVKGIPELAELVTNYKKIDAVVDGIFAKLKKLDAKIDLKSKTTLSVRGEVFRQLVDACDGDFASLNFPDSHDALDAKLLEFCKVDFLTAKQRSKIDAEILRCLPPREAVIATLREEEVKGASSSVTMQPEMLKALRKPENNSRIQFLGADKIKLLLPKTLFHFNASKSKSISPSTPFNSAAAVSVEGNAFKSLISPSQEPSQKVIILDRNSFSQPMAFDKAIAFVARLKNSGFQIYFKSREGFVEVDSRLTKVTDMEPTFRWYLQEFDPQRDYAEMAKLNIARDKAVLVDRATRLEIEDCLSEGCNHEAGFYSSDLHGSFRYLSLAEMNAEMSRLKKEEPDDFRHLVETFCFFLRHCNSEDTANLLRNNVDYFVTRAIDLKDPNSMAYIINTAPLYINEIMRRGSAAIMRTGEVESIDEIRFARFIENITSLNLQRHLIEKFVDKASLKYLCINRTDFLLKAYLGQPDFVQNLAKKIGDFAVLGAEDLALKLFLKPQEAEVLLKAHRNLVANNSTILKIISAAPNAPRLMEIWCENYNSADFQNLKSQELISTIAKLPNRSKLAQILISKIADQNLALELLINPHQAESFIEERGNLITDANQLVCCFTALLAAEKSDLIRKLLAKVSPEVLSSVKLSSIPEEDRKKLPSQVIERLILTKGSLVGADVLADNLKAVPDFEKVLKSMSWQKNDAAQILHGISQSGVESDLVFDLKEDHELLCSFPSPRPEVFQKKKSQPTSFYISKLSKAALEALEQQHRDDLSKVAVLKIAEIEDDLEPEDLQGFDVLFPDLKYVETQQNFAAIKLRNLLPHYREYIGLEYITNSKKSLFAGQLQATAERIPGSAKTKTEAKTNRAIEIASDGLNGFIDASRDILPAFFWMSEAGTVLNGSSDGLSIRTKILRHNILEDLTEEEFLPTIFSRINLTTEQLLTEKNIKDLESKSKSEGTYYRFNCKLKKGEKLRLNSVSTAEDLVGIMASKGARVTIEKSREDDFYYATAEDKSCALSYVVKVGYVQSYEEDFPEEHPIRKIIDKYRNSEKFKFISDGSVELPKYKKENHAAWLQKVYDDISGVCRHRAAAVEYALLNCPEVNPKDVRVIFVNNKHVALEVRHREKWHYIELGGGKAFEMSTRKIKEMPIAALVPLTIVAAPFVISAAAVASVAAPFYYVGKKISESYKKGKKSKIAVESKKEIEMVTVAREEELKSNSPPLNLSSPVSSQLSSAVSRPVSPQIVENTSFIEKFTAIAKKFLQPVPVRKEAELIAKVSERSNKRISLVAANVASHANYLLAQAHATGRPVFYIDSPDKIDFNLLHHLFLRQKDRDVVPEIEEMGALANFLLSCQREDQSPPLLMINWSAFSDKQKLTLNTLLDRQPRIAGRPISEKIQIISLDNKELQDSSFRSRHDIHLSSSCNFIDRNVDDRVAIQDAAAAPSSAPLSAIAAPISAAPAAAKIIDIEGLDNWREVLFGRIPLKGERMEWNRSEFVQALLSGENNLEIRNLPEAAKQKFEYEIAQAKAERFFKYHDYHIPLPANFAVSFPSQDFNFAELNIAGHKFIENTNCDIAPIDAALINGNLFDHLLYDKDYIAGLYIEMPGLIAKASKKEDKTLKLFISGALSKNQWYCLLKKAQNMGVELQLYLAPEINLPAEIEDVKKSPPIFDVDSVHEEKREEPIIAQKPRIIIAQNTSAVAKTLRADAVFDVEDYSYADLLDDVTPPKIDKSGFKDFYKIRSQLLERLEAGEKIILKGKFESNLLQMLHPLLSGKYPAAVNNLTIIIEESDLPMPGATYEPLAFLPPRSYEIQEINQKKTRPLPPFKETVNLAPLDSNSAFSSKKFIENRKLIFLNFLNTNNLLQLVGHSGTGKSSLMREFEKDAKENPAACPVRIYREMQDFENWIKPSDDGKIKILFIDESNIEDQNFMWLAPLKKDGNKRILYKGKIHDLTENHKVVFARNPKEYGGGRVDQKLFADNSIPEMHLADFPTSYIYEKILKESIYDELSPLVRAQVSEEEFKTNCQKLIADYQKFNAAISDQAKAKTVRFLQEQALEMIAEKYRGTLPWNKIPAENFVSTEATKEVELAIASTLRIRNLQRERDAEGNRLFPNKAVGLNGILLEGESGIGKSEMISAMLKGQDYDKIDASQGFKEKEAIAIKAFEEGKILWIDELNSCIDDGFEKVLNAILTGAHPVSGKPSENPGVALIASINSAGEVGRSIIGAALGDNRLKRQKTPALTAYKSADLQEIITSWKLIREDLAPTIIPILADAFPALGMNLRTLREVLQSQEVQELDIDSLMHNLSTTAPSAAAAKPLLPPSLQVEISVN